MSNTLENLNNFANTVTSIPNGLLSGYMDLVSSGKDAVANGFHLPQKTVEAVLEGGNQIILTPTQLASSAENLAKEVNKGLDKTNEAINSPNITLIASVIGIISVLKILKPV